MYITLLRRQRNTEQTIPRGWLLNFPVTTEILLRRMGDSPGTHPVHVDIQHATHQVDVGVHGGGMVAILPVGTAPLFACPRVRVSRVWVRPLAPEHQLKLIGIKPQVHIDTGDITQGDNRGPFHMPKKGIKPAGLAHQRHAGCRPDRQ